jgi:hypothetical protein
MSKQAAVAWRAGGRAFRGMYRPQGLFWNVVCEQTFTGLVCHIH